MPKRILAAVIVFAITAALFSPLFSENSTVIAANGPLTSCLPSTTCQIGEFLFDDSYVPITTATCTITSKYPDGTAFLSSVALTAAADGWYGYEFTTPTTTGVYRTLITCVTGPDTLSLDKSFKVESSSALSESQVASAVWNSQKSDHNLTGTFGQSLQNIVPSTGDISKSVWEYSNRTLTSFGSLITDIWKDKTNSQNQLIKTTSENRLLLERLVNKPIIQNFLEDDSNLDSKITESKKIADKLQINTQYLKSKTQLMNLRFSSLETSQLKSISAELANLVGTESNLTEGNIAGQIDWIKSSWDWTSIDQVSQSAKNIQKHLANVQNGLSTSGKSQIVNTAIRNLSQEATKLDLLVGSKNSVNQSTIWGNLNSSISLIGDFDQNDKNIDSLISQMSQKSNADIENKTNAIANNIFNLNKVPNAQTVLFQTNQPLGGSNSKSLKNKLLSLKGLIVTNKKMLAKKPNTPFASTWVEEGSIVFKSLITNPSTLISQDAEVKYYIPQEIKKEEIISVDNGLEVAYDIEKNQSYVKGTISLLPKQSKTLSVKTQDIWNIKPEEIETFRKQAEEFSKPLKDTSYFAQGVTLKSDINTQLDKVVELTKNQNTPELKIKSYREAMVELVGVKEKIDSLKDLTIQAGSMGSLKGFIGGAQVFAVWGITIIFASGFALVAFYLKKQGLFKTIAKKQKIETIIRSKVKANEATVIVEEVPVPQPKIKLKFKLAAAVIVIMLTGTSGFTIYSVFSANSKSSSANPQIVSSSEQPSVLGTTVDKSITIFVPTDSNVNLHQEPTIDSQVITTLNSSQEAKILEEKDYWVKVKTASSQGWISKDFIESAESGTNPISNNINQSVPESLATATILQTPTGFLRVREVPNGTEIAQIQPGDKFQLIEKEEQWIKIKIDEQTSGWVSRQYTEIN